jgi:hypothetical protein
MYPGKQAEEHCYGYIRNAFAFRFPKLLMRFVSFEGSGKAAYVHQSHWNFE